MKTVAIIPAGGSGRRMQGNLSKQYLLLDGEPVLFHTLKIFQESPMIDDIFLIVPKEDIQPVRQLIVEKKGLSKVSRVLAGGKERQDSVKNGIDLVGSKYDVVVIHDGVRPFISEELIHQTIREVSKEGAVTVGVPVKDTVKTVDGEGWIKATLKRDNLWLVQTPQTFRRDVIVEAHKRACDDHYYGTDDASLVERIGVNVKMIPGSYENIKITTREDLTVAEVFIKRLKAGRDSRGA